MLCEKCQQKQATMHLQQVVNGEKTEMHLCQDCAGSIEMPISIDSFFQGFLDSFIGKATMNVGSRKTLVCPSCGLSYDDFRKTGRLGCGNCYSAFGKELDGIFKSVQSSSRHNGKFPRKYGGELLQKRELEQLKRALVKAVESEEYEEAAKLRDKIKEYDHA